MTDVNPFVLEKTQYKRNINPIKHYCEDAARYISKMSGQPYDSCFSFVKKQVREIIVDPKVHYLDKNQFGDRVEKHSTMTEFLSDTLTNKQLLAPTFTSYTNPKEEESPLVGFIGDNVKRRGVAKKAMFKAEMAGNLIEMAVQEVTQKGRKTANNACSGAHVSSSTPLYNRTAHSTLTSTCRSTSGYGNANNEKMLAGNRHYHLPSVVRNNIISIINRADLNKIEQIVNKYNLVIPTVSDVMRCIHRCSRQYWRSEKEMFLLLELVRKMTDIERAAFMYVGDLHNVMKFNDGFMRTFIGKLSKQVRDIHPDAENILKQNREELRILAMQFFETELRGVEYHKLSVEQKGMVASTVLNIQNTIIEYRDFIEAMLVTICVPASLAFFPSSIREAALTSDTDSTIFTVQDWTIWYCGGISFSDEASAIAATMIFLAAETITHILAMMSANFGIRSELIHQIAMKNEFKFSSFIPTQVGKHYFADITCQEGNIYKNSKEEIKGVHLKASNVPPEVMKKAKAMMIDTMNKVKQGEKLSLLQRLQEVAEIEHGIYESIRKGEGFYFKNSQIKTPASYKKVESSPYQYYLFWNEVFADKYGIAPEPPYTALVISLKINNPTEMMEWTSKIKDKKLVERLVAWAKKNDKKSIGSIHIPQSAVSLHGIPEEILLAVDVRGIIRNMTNVFYLILETYGYYCMNDKITRLISDEYKSLLLETVDRPLIP